MARRPGLVAAVRGSGGFVCDTAPLVYRIERTGPAPTIAAVDSLFDEVDNGVLGCLVSTIVAAELLVRPYRLGTPSAPIVDGYLRSSTIGLVEPSLGVAHGAARLVAKRVVPRLSDAIVAATAAEVGLPLVTGDRRLARAVGGLLVQDFA